MDGHRGAHAGVDRTGNSNGLSRAERFEDEKRRIIDSCFSKKGTDGALLESYITHIRIIEDAAYPSSPPPPNSDPEFKKPRVIIVAVRKSGHVRMHKGRENVNGTFSIGKTWPLDDLSAVESFGSTGTTSGEDVVRKQWAGGAGFIVTIGKPYYWQANTAKEKQFFIMSLVKIFTKYTGGKVPELIGFDDREKEQLLGISGSQGRPAPLAQAHPPFQTTPSPGSGYSSTVARPHTRQAPSSDIGQRETAYRQDGSTGGVSNLSGQSSRPAAPLTREGTPSSNVDYSVVSAQQSQSSLRRLPGGNASQDSFGQIDHSSGPPPRSRNGLPTAPNRFQDRSATPNSQRTMSTENSMVNGGEVPANPTPAPLSLPPERRRPPITSTTSIPHRTESNDSELFPAPLKSPPLRQGDVQPIEGLRPQIPESTATSSGALQETGNVQPITTLEAANAAQPSTASAQNSSPERKPFAAITPLPSSLTNAAPTEEERPGLGPMIKNKKSKAEIASSFRKAAFAANAFKPRPGGAAERLREQQAKSLDGPDGITGVVPAPSLVRQVKNDNATVEQPDTSLKEDLSQSQAKVSDIPRPIETVPEVKITVPQPERPSSIQGPVEHVAVVPTPVATKRDASPAKQEISRPKTMSESTQKAFGSLGLDSSILDGRGAEFINLLDEFGWVDEGVRTRNIDELKDDIERELNKAQAGGWLGRIDEEDDRIEGIKKGIDLTIAEIEELDGLLTLYGVELGTLSEDIAYIEAQSQGLQVQTANQKLLQTELKSLLETITISATQLQSLREASLESPRGLEQVEASLILLFKAMATIDPNLNFSGTASVEDGTIRSDKGVDDNEISNMRVLQEKKDTYRSESVMFLRRLKPFLQVRFGMAIDETRKMLEREKDSLTRRSAKFKSDTRSHDEGRNMLWRYSPLMLFSREINRSEWEDFIRTYEAICKPVYQDEFRTAIGSWKKTARKPTGDENEILFTSQIEKQSENLAATTARKLTVKRTGTLGKVLRSSPIGDTGSKTHVDKIQDGRLHHYEVFSGVLEELAPLLITEQNFVVDFFHISSLELKDFPDAVAAASPEARRGNDLRKLKPVDPNRELAKRVVQSLEDIYSFFPAELQSLVDWTIQVDPVQGVGIIAAIERKLHEVEDTSQEYLTRTLQKLHQRLSGLFNKFLDEQIRAIEDTKVKINKRKGVIAFIRIFPSFSASLETMLAAAESLEIRATVNTAYNRINKTMFESLKVIARENPAAAGTGAAMGDPEDKEALNYQILLIENMNHYIEEVDARNNPVLEDWKETAAKEFDEHLNLYLGAVIRRPFGKLLDFLESTESQLQSLPQGAPPSNIAARASHSKATFKRLLATYDSKEIRRGIETLKKRVEKHFGDADDPGLSRGLVANVLEACEKYYENVEKRVVSISADVYDGEAMIEWSKSDVSGAFRGR